MGKITYDKNNYRRHGSKNQAQIRKSLEECGAGRSVLLDADDSLIAGNGVYEQAQKLGLPVRIIETDGTELVAVKRTDLHTEDSRRKKLAFADNLTGESSTWDLEAIQADAGQLDVQEWGVDLEGIGGLEAEPLTGEEQKPSDTPKQRAQKRNLRWGVCRGDKDEARCNMVEKPQLHFRGGYAYCSTYHYSEEGVMLSEIKAPEQVDLFAENAVKLLRGILGVRQVDDICLITTPRRRHADWNFADEVCKRISQLTGIHYEPDVVTARTKKRIDPDFSVQKMPSQKTLVLYDDIVTTGATLLATLALFPEKNVVTVIGICNLKT